MKVCHITHGFLTFLMTFYIILLWLSSIILKSICSSKVISSKVVLSKPFWCPEKEDGFVYVVLIINSPCASGSFFVNRKRSFGKILSLKYCTPLQQWVMWVVLGPLGRFSVCPKPWSQFTFPWNRNTNLLPFLYSNYLNLVVSIRISYILCASNDEEPEFEDPDESFEVLTDMSEKIRKRKNLTKQ